MTGRLASLRPELGPMIRLAVPVVLAELAWMGMGVVDVLMVGRLGPDALGAVGLGRSIFFVPAVYGLGLLLGLDTMVSNAFGAGRIRECRQALVHGLYFAVLLAIPAIPVMFLAISLLDEWGIDPAVIPLTVDYVSAVSWSALPLLLYVAFRRYLQAVNVVRPVMMALVSANLVNVFCNWVLIFGNLGAPAMGTAGAGWATFVSSWYMALFLLVATLVHGRSEPEFRGLWPWRPDGAIARRLFTLGFPASIQVLLEMGVFALATALVGKLDSTSLAAHQIAITAASVTFMVPLGMSSAGAVRVGQALGRDDLPGAARAGWTALLLGAGFMSISATVFVSAPASIVRLFTTEAAVLSLGVTLVLWAAAFQLSDGIQVVATGILRGAADTRTPMLWNLVGYWLLGLPLGYYLCFHRAWGAPGIWLGLTLGLIIVGAVLLFVWWRKVRHWTEAAA